MVEEHTIITSHAMGGTTKQHPQQSIPHILVQMMEMCSWRLLSHRRSVLGAMIISLGGVAMIAQPSFLFGGRGINKLGLGLAIMQVSVSFLLLPSLFFLSLFAFSWGNNCRYHFSSAHPLSFPFLF